jgi:futalosine hydrolase
MPLNILFVSATLSEAGIVKKIADGKWDGGTLIFRDSIINILVTGVGAMSTAWSLQRWISSNEKPDIAINAGIAGSYRDDIKKGDVVMPVSDCFADSGIEDGREFLTLFEAGLADQNDFPFRNGLLCSDERYRKLMENHIRPVNAITVNTATGSGPTRDKLVAKYNPDIETMEGATFFYICLMENIPFLSLRAVSNKVEVRNRGNWDINLALGNLSEKFKEILLNLC